MLECGMSVGDVTTSASQGKACAPIIYKPMPSLPLFTLFHCTWCPQDNKVSEGQQQWWQFKARHFDSVLLFKMGKFYEVSRAGLTSPVKVREYD